MEKEPHQICELVPSKDSGSEDKVKRDEAVAQDSVGPGLTLGGSACSPVLGKKD